MTKHRSQRRSNKTKHSHKATHTHSQTARLHITALTHDGRGIGTYGQEFGDRAGKKVFVNFALPTETVIARTTKSKKHFDEADCVEIITKSSHRTVPICPHFGVCGGCALQHFDEREQINFKQSVLANHLNKANITPENWLPPIMGDRTHYRTKARLGVRYLPKNDELIVGFRERASNFLTDIDTCPILDKRVGDRLFELKRLLKTLDGKGHITHIEIAMGDDVANLANVAIVVRHIKPLNQSDKSRLLDFGKTHAWQVYGENQNGIYAFDGGQIQGVFYDLPDFHLTLKSLPADFTQVNLSVNRQMVSLACELLDLQKGERVLDLFCGLGNFSLALAKCVGDTGQVIGVEGDTDMVARASQNALNNHLTNTQFFAQDLTQDFSHKSWAKSVDALLIDPPRTGAWEVMAYLGQFHAKRIVYVSCDPATLVRDSTKLIAQGYKMTHIGVMDMFCHTAHVESIARFEKI